VDVCTRVCRSTGTFTHAHFYALIHAQSPSLHLHTHMHTHTHTHMHKHLYPPVLHMHTHLYISTPRFFLCKTVFGLNKYKKPRFLMQDGFFIQIKNGL
jgi:hypothetical protein